MPEIINLEEIDAIRMQNLQINGMKNIEIIQNTPESDAHKYLLASASYPNTT
jgi:hypothetical protein